MSIIEQIKAEIERRLSYYHPENVNHGLASGFREDGKAIAYEELLSFLDTLESEKPMQEGLEEEITRTYHDGSVADTTEMDHVDYENIARHFYELGCRRTAEKYDEIEYNRQRVEEPPVALVAIKPMLPDALKPCIATFKERGGSSEIPNNPECLADAGKTLDEAAEKADDEGIVGFECGFCITAKHPRDYFIAGAEWAMEQGKTFVCHTEGNACDDEEFYWFPVNQIWQYVRWELPLNKEFIVQIRKKD